MPVIPATQETEIGELWFEASPGKLEGPYFKKKIQTKGLGNMAHEVDCFA
jgi:hypothetical protein